MRLISVLLLTVALATASGCFGRDDGDTEPTPTTPTGTTPTPTSPTGSTPTTPTTNTSTETPPPPAPRELCALSFDFQNNVQPGPPPTEVTAADCGTVPAGYTTMTLNGNFTSAEPAILTQGVSVSILDASGATVLTCSGPAAGPAAGVVCMSEGQAMAGGAYTVQYDGAGNIDFAGSVTVS